MRLFFVLSYFFIIPMSNQRWIARMPSLDSLEVTLKELEPTESWPYRWQCVEFPSVLIYSSVPEPWGQIVQVAPSSKDATNRYGRTYVSGIRVRLTPVAEEPTHEVDIIRDESRVSISRHCVYGSSHLHRDYKVQEVPELLTFIVRPL